MLAPHNCVLCNLLTFQINILIENMSLRGHKYLGLQVQAILSATEKLSVRGRERAVETYFWGRGKPKRGREK